jgi:hypothetical protein
MMRARAASWSNQLIQLITWVTGAAICKQRIFLPQVMFILKAYELCPAEYLEKAIAFFQT